MTRPVALLCPLAFALASSVGVLGCGVDRQGSGLRGSTFSVAYDMDSRLFGPDDEDALYLIFLSLVRYDERGELEGRLARSWEHSTDYREWTYHLRTDVRWHDGKRVTAHDVQFTLELLAHPAVHELSSGDFGGATVLDDSTIVIQAADPEYYQMQVVYYPRHLIEALDPKAIWQWEFWWRPVGNGPYRFVRRVPQTLVELEANPDYFLGKPDIERVVIRFLGDAGLSELLAGRLDAVLYLPLPKALPRLAADPRLRIYPRYWEISGGGGRSSAIYWQTRHPLFRDARVRRALTLAIDRGELLRVLNLPASVPILAGFYTERQIRRGDLTQPLPYDTARARALMDEVGWRDRDGDGWLDREGQDFHFTALVFSGSGWDQTIAIYVQDQLRRLGVRMDLQPMQSLWPRVRAGEFEAAVMQVWLYPERFAGSESPVGYANPELSGLLYQLTRVAEPDSVDAIYRRVAEIFRDEAPVTFLFPRVEVAIVHRRVGGLSSPWRADPMQFMEDLWLEDER